MKRKHLPISFRTVATTAALAAGGPATAHEWHRHDGETGTPAPAPVFEIPAGAGTAPADSAAVAERAEAFSAFHPDVRFRWDDDWFYVESDGMPDHGMMTGIASWQQQVGVPQYYYGDNAWQIPLRPQLSDSPISAADNLFRGAIALAVNGVPIFNALNNRGDDALLAGELDQWGGHAGRADDYHYHIAPLHLQEVVGVDQPIAYALDGYPIYGLTEPDGSEAVGLDEYNGHFDSDGDYHYHSTLTYPYINGGLRGVVALEGGQVEPQPGTREFRPALAPLNGATITGFESPADDSYSITYTLDGGTHRMSWSVDRAAGTVTYEFVAPDGGSTSQTYTGWQPSPELASPDLSATEGGSGDLGFTAVGEPGIGYPFSYSADLQTWHRFGFLRLGATGSATFDLTPVGDRGFLKMGGAGTSTTGGGGTTAAASITQGLADTVVANLFPAGQRVSAVGAIAATDGTAWTVPAETGFATATRAPDLYNPINGVTPANIGAVDLDSLPVVQIDADGEVVTGYLFADNYFELYVNGVLVGVDPIPFTPFNSCVVRFRAKAPITYAVKLVDWEENLGVGTEDNRGNPHHPGDGGFVASFSDGTVTGSHWKAQVYYIAPVDDPSNVVVLADGTRDSSAAPTATGAATSFGVHWEVPADWSTAGFDDSGWPDATTYTNATVGVDNKPSYTNFEDQFAGASFIWSSNLVLDNEVIVRFTSE